MPVGSDDAQRLSMIRRLTAVLAFLIAPVLFAQHTVTPENVLLPLTSSPTLVIPVAGATAGANNTFFRSDINLINLGNTDQRVIIQWLPQGRTGQGLISRDITLPAQSGFFSEDFVTNVLQQTGLGAIVIQAVDGEGTYDSTARLYGTSRIWTPQPGTDHGTVSQTLPGQSRKWIFGVRRDERYRLNVGVLNRDAEVRRFRIQTLGSIPQGGGEVIELELQPLSMHQVNIPGTATGSFQIIVENISTNNGTWETWASSIDNVTGDGWTSVGFYPPTAQ
jgi:hypothetical protein